ncbi:Ig-like domain-containing protein [Archangium lipolyticum]|uniref:Ig-like domain-containing protein n=1 Tax=Archangium lipolyticum TaxID=2970465 RepID=UPI002149D5C6|nr:Ig-like domain-containing protein [Archangium lipolyticum]
MNSRLWATSAALLCALSLPACIELPEVEEPVPENPTDLTRPLLSGTVPGDATTAPVDTRIEITFSEPMDPASVTVSAMPAMTLGMPAWNTERTQVTFQPATALSNDTTYTLTVSGRDTAGNTLDGQSTLTFTATLEQVPPALASSSPAHGATYVAVNTQVVLTFSEPMDPTRVKVALSPAHSNLGTPSWSGDKRTVKFTPTPILKYGTPYTLSIQGTDEAGNALAATTVGFETQSLPDTTPPTVASTAPGGNSTDADINTNVSLHFSEAMDTESATSAFSIHPTVPGILTWDPSRKLLTFDPTASLAYSTVYTVTLGTGAMDATGNALAAPFSFKFTTSNAPDLTRPQLTGYSPSHTQTGLSRSTSISVSFSEPMDKANTQAAFAIASPSGVAGDFTWSADGRTMTFTPASGLAYGTDINWSLDASARDLAGNTLGTGINASFRIIRQLTADLPVVAGNDGYAIFDISRKTYRVNIPSTTYRLGLDFDFEGGTATTFYPLADMIFLTFDLGQLPADLSSIKDASLNVYISTFDSDPFTRFGDMNVSSVNYGATLEASDYTSAIVYHVTTWHPTGRGWSSAPVLAAVDGDWRNQGTRGKRTQLRLHFNVPDNLTPTYYSGDGALLILDSRSGTNKPYLRVTYETP